MKKSFFAAVLVLSALPAFAQRYPNSCHVVAVDRYNRAIAHFYGPADFRTGTCREVLRRCMFETRRRNQPGLTCIQVRNR